MKIKRFPLMARHTAHKVSNPMLKSALLASLCWLAIAPPLQAQTTTAAQKATASQVAQQGVA